MNLEDFKTKVETLIEQLDEEINTEDAISWLQGLIDQFYAWNK